MFIYVTCCIIARYDKFFSKGDYGMKEGKREEILRLIDDGKISEAQQYLWKKVHQQDTDALAIIGFLYFYGVGLKKDEQKGKKILQEAVQKGNVVAADFIKNIE